DLRALLAAAGEHAPYVLVPHSYGGLVALLYARLHPEEVAGFVMVDAASDLLRQEAAVGFSSPVRAATLLIVPKAHATG
ncbi:MAG: alpha/beta fold hydrolase, partial [Methyloceanibacter sp.]